MDSTQLNKLSMYRAVSALLVSSAQILRDITPLPEKLAKLSEKIAEIAALAAVQSLPTTGSVVDRNTALDEAAHHAQVLAGLVLSYADAKSLGDLAAKVRLTSSDFNYGRKEERLQLAQSVHDAAQAVVADLGSYGVTPEKLEDLEGRIATARVALSGPRTIATAKKSATQRLPVVFRQVDQLLENQIDPLLVPLKKTNPQWHAKYVAARIIIDRPGGLGSRDTGNGSGTGATPATPAEPASAGRDKKT